MFIYIIIFLYLLFLTYKYDVKKSKQYFKVNYIFSCIVLIIVAGVRYRIGYDTSNYMESYKYAPSLSDIINGLQFYGDPLWMYIIAISKEIYNDFFVVQIFQAIIVNVAVFWFVKRHSPKPFLSILLYFLLLWWNLCFEAMREAIAASFFLYALDAILFNKGLKAYYLRVWPAIFAHTFGFVTLLFPFIKYLKINKYTIIVIIVILVMTFSIKDYINDITMLLEMASEISADSTSDLALDKATEYFDSDTFGESNLSVNGVISMVIGGIFPCLVLIFMLKNKTVLGKSNLTPFVFVYLCIVILRLQIPIFFRFLNYFELLVIVAFTQAIYLERITIKRQIAYFSMFAMVFIRMYSLNAYDVGTLVKAYRRYVPYNSIFQRNYNKESETIFSSK